VNLDQLLGSMSVDQLQDLAAAWAPGGAISRSKLELFRVLREQMTKPARARRCLENCGKLERGIVRKLLRSAKVSQSVAVLAASSSARPKSLDDTRAAVAQLTAMGLAFVEPEKRWETYGSARVTVPEELIAPLRVATGIDGRPWPEILNLADHIESLSDRELARRVRAAGLSGEKRLSSGEVAAQLAAPEACRGRLAALSPGLRAVVIGAVCEHAGIVPAERLREIGAKVRPKNALVAGWRKELEANLIGTVGDVSLLDYGVALDGRALVVFTEVTEALLNVPCDDGARLPDPVGPDFLLDLSELIATVRESGAKLKGSGALTDAACNRIVAKMNRASLPEMDARELLEVRVACAEKLGLIERGGDSLVVRRSAWEWEGRSYAEKAADLFGLVGLAAPVPRSMHHHDGLCEIARGLFRAMSPGEWRRSGTLVSIALRRYLAGVESSGLRAHISKAVHEVDEYVLPPFPGLKQLADDLRESVVMEAYAMGILDLTVDGGRIVGESLSQFGAVAAGQAAGHQPPAKLITAPDFEVIILPEGDTTRLRYEVGQFAAGEKFEQTCHMRITKERVEEAVVRGLSADDMIRVLHDHSETGSVVQNVEYSIRGWAERVRVATVENVYVFELPDEELLKVVAELPELKKLVVRRISATALALSERPSDRRLLADLCRLGVYVR